MYNKLNKLADLEKAQLLIENAISLITVAGEGYLITREINDCLTAVCYSEGSIDDLKNDIENLEEEPKDDSWMDDVFDTRRDAMLERKYGNQL